MRALWPRTYSLERSAPGQRSRASLFLVALPPVRVLFLCANYLFVAAIDAWGSRACAESANQNERRSRSRSERVQFSRDQRSNAPHAAAEGVCADRLIGAPAAPQVVRRTGDMRANPAALTAQQPCCATVRVGPSDGDPLGSIMATIRARRSHDGDADWCCGWANGFHLDCEEHPCAMC